MRIAALLLFIAVAVQAQTGADVLLEGALSQARSGSLDDAEHGLRRAALVYPKDKRFHTELAGIYYRERRPAAAKTELRAALRLDPADSYASEFLGTLYLLDGNFEAALEYWNGASRPIIQDVRFTEPSALDPVLRSRAVAITGGQILTLDRLRETETNFERLDAFPTVRVSLLPREGQGYEAVIDPEPPGQLLTGWRGRLLPYLSGLPYQTLYFDRHNIGRRGIVFNSLWRWDSDKRRIQLAVAGPLNLDPRYRYRLLIDARDENWNLTGSYCGAGIGRFKLRRIESGGDFELGFSSRLRWTMGVRVAGRWFGGADVDPVFSGGWSFAVPTRAEFRLLDLPARRIRLDSTEGLHAGRLFGSAHPGYDTIDAEIRAAWLPEASGDNWRITARVRAARTFGFAPFDEFSQLGMERDNDLWFRGIVGTRNGEKGAAPLGTNYNLTQFDLERKLFHSPVVSITTGPFFDGGDIGGPSPRFGSHGFATATGVQTRIAASGRIKLTVVYGRDLSDGRGVFYSAVTR